MLNVTMLSAGASARAELDKIRAQLGTLAEKRESLVRSPITAAEAADAALADIRRLAEGNALLRLDHYAHPGGSIVFLAQVSAADVWAMQFNLAPERFEGELRKYFEVVCKGSGPPATERVRLLADLDRKIGQAREREDAAWVALLARGILTERAEPGGPEDLERLLRAMDSVADEGAVAN